MSSKFYMEIGTGCFARCKTCDIHDKDRIHHVSYSDRLRTIRELMHWGFTEVRFTGYDPLTYERLQHLTQEIHYWNIKKVINTTLLSANLDDIVTCALYDEVIVSLSAVGDKYEEFFGVDRFHVLDKNLRSLLAITSGKVTINYVVTKDTRREDLFKFTEYMNSIKHFGLGKLNVMFFPELRYDDYWDNWPTDQMDCWLAGFKYKLLADGIPTTWTPSFKGKKIDYCCVFKQRLYIRSNGDVHPCCNSGGEIGQTVYDETCLGNILKDDINALIDNKAFIKVNNEVCNRCTPKYYRLMND